MGGALDDLRKAVSLEANDVAIRKELTRVESLHRESLANERGAFQGVFDKMRKTDDARDQREEARRKLEAEKEAQIKAEEDKAKEEERRREAEEKRKEREARSKK